MVAANARKTKAWKSIVKYTCSLSTTEIFHNILFFVHWLCTRLCQSMASAAEESYSWTDANQLYNIAWVDTKMFETNRGLFCALLVCRTRKGP